MSASKDGSVLFSWPFISFSLPACPFSSWVDLALLLVVWPFHVLLHFVGQCAGQDDTYHFDNRDYYRCYCNHHCVLFQNGRYFFDTAHCIVGGHWPNWTLRALHASMQLVKRSWRVAKHVITEDYKPIQGFAAKRTIHGEIDVAEFAAGDRQADGISSNLLILCGNVESAYRMPHLGGLGLFKVLQAVHSTALELKVGQYY